MSAPDLHAFVRASAFSTLAARRVAWSRGYLALLVAAFAGTAALFEAADVSEALRDWTFLGFAVAILVVPRLVKARRARAGLMVTSKDEAPRSWASVFVMSAVALAVYATLSLPGMDAHTADALLPSVGLAAVGGWSAWNGSRIGVWEHGLLGAAFTACGVLLGFGVTALAWAVLSTGALIGGGSLHLRWLGWERKHR